MMVWSEAGEGAGVTVTAPDRETLLADIETRLRGGRGFSIATLNLDHAVKLARDPAFRRAYEAQTHVTADGRPVVWLSRLAGQKNVSLVPGSELVDPLAALAARLDVPVALYGATPETLAATARRLQVRHPGLDVVFQTSPPMGMDVGDAATAADIAALGASGAGLCFLALGAPRQEIFAARAQELLPGMGFVSVGAGLDFVAGSQRRAPAWVRAVAAEWLWRLLGDPRRLAARYGACLRALPGLTWQALRHRLKGRAGP